MFHRVVDCLASEYVAVKQAFEFYKTPCFIGYLNRAEFYQALGVFPPGDPRLLCDKENIIPAAALIRASDQHGAVQNNSSTGLSILGPKKDNYLRSITELREDVQLLMKKSPIAGSNTILIAQREKYRNFDKQSFGMLLRSFRDLAENFGKRLDVYHGTESTEMTLQKFHAADIFLGFHGAAIANMLFAREGVGVIEITTYLDSTDSELWRTNLKKLEKLREDLGTVVYHVPVSSAFPQMNFTGITSKEIKVLQNITLRKSDVDNLVGIARNLLRKANTSSASAAAKGKPHPG